MTLLLYYYGEFCQFVLFQESETTPRCGVTFTNGGMIFYWNRKFLDKTPQKHVNFIVLHEIFHLILDHPRRIRRGGYDMKISNQATDMIINTAIKSDFIDVDDTPTKYFIEIPTEKRMNDSGKIEDEIWVLMMPPEYKGDHVYEELYEWLKEERKKFDKWKSDGDDSWLNDGENDGEEKDNDGKGKKGKGESGKEKGKDNDGGVGDEDDKNDGDSGGKNDGEEKSGKGKKGKEKNSKGEDCPVSDYLRRIFEESDKGTENWLDSHIPSSIPDEIRKSIVEDVKEHLRQRGFEKSKVRRTLDKLVKSKKDHLREIKTNISSIKGYNKVKTITKKNRRNIPGIKGRRKEGFGLNVILDVSGSMGGYFQRSLSYIFQNNITINLIQCDNQIQKIGNRSYTIIKSKKEFKKIEIQGLGGTELQSAIDLIHDTKELKLLNVLILTDGETDALDVSKIRKCLILSIRKKCPILAGNPRQIVVDDDIARDDW